MNGHTNYEVLFRQQYRLARERAHRAEAEVEELERRCARARDIFERLVGLAGYPLQDAIDEWLAT